MRGERPVLIVGAGPVGLAAAVELTRRGLPVRLIDRGEGPVPEEQSRALGLLPTTLRLLAPSGLAAAMLEEGRTLTGARICVEGRPLFTLRFAGAAPDHAFVLALPQGRTERLMLAWLAERGVVPLRSTTIAAIRDTHRPRAILSSGEEIDCRAVIGCDGAHSAVRRILDVPFVGEDMQERFALADVALARSSPDDRIGLDLLPGRGAVARFPFGEGRLRLVGVAGAAEGLDALTASEGQVLWRSDFAVAFRHAERMARGLVFLAGDAAHVHSPVGARGMNLGIWDAAVLAFLLSEGRESEYEMRRLPSVRRVLGETRRATQSLRSPSAAFVRTLRWGGPVAASLPPLRHALARRVLALDLPLPAGL